MIAVGICLVSLAALNRAESQVSSPRPGAGYGGGGYGGAGSGGSVTLPFDPFRYERSTMPNRWPEAYDPAYPGRGYRPPALNNNPNRWGMPYRSPEPGWYGGQSNGAGTGARGPGR
jgi:hypothetical protein